MPFENREPVSERKLTGGQRIAACRNSHTSVSRLATSCSRAHVPESRQEGPKVVGRVRGSRSRLPGSTGSLEGVELLPRQQGDLGRRDVEAVQRGIAALPSEREGTISEELSSHCRRREAHALVNFVAEPEAEGRQLVADGKLRGPALTSAQLGAGERGEDPFLGAAGGLRPGPRRRRGHFGEAAERAAGVPHGLSQNSYGTITHTHTHTCTRTQPHTHTHTHKLTHTHTHTKAFQRITISNRDLLFVHSIVLHQLLHAQKTHTCIAPSARDGHGQSTQTNDTQAYFLVSGKT